MRRKTRFNLLKALIALNVLFLLFMSTPVISSESSKDETLDFLRVIDDKAAYNRNPEKFEAVTWLRTPHAIYVERVPSFSIPKREIVSITIEKEKIYSREVDVEQLVKGRASSKSTKEKLETYVYKATFSLTRAAKRKMDDFANSHDQKTFDLRLGKGRLGTVQFIGPFGGDAKNEFSTFIESTNPGEVKKIFAPIQDKVIWK